jgi:S-formylglutathione hydrolase FrmB
LNFKDTTLNINNVIVDISIPDGNIKGTILMLPGWNFSRNDCCLKSSFCQKAKEKGFCLIKPEMGKSVYHSKIYNETRKDWQKYPSLANLIDTIIPFIQEHFHLLKKGDKNFVYGISTGARGVAQLAIYTKDIFIAGACLSGDFNQIKMINDKLMQGFYGKYENFPERWQGKDNPFYNAEKIKMPLYIAHGKKDKIVPYQQSEMFYNELLRKNKKNKYQLLIAPNAEHNYQFWDSRTDDILNFFLKYAY